MSPLHISVHYTDTKTLDSLFDMSFFGIAQPNQGNVQEYEFDDTYDDNLGGQLDESGDAFNDETFGGEASVGRDFDFHGETAKISYAIDEDQVAYERRAPQHAQMQHQQQQHQQRQAPPSLQPMASLWGAPDQKERIMGDEAQHGGQQAQQAHLQQQQHYQHVAAQQGGQQPLSLEQIEAQLMGRQAQAQGQQQQQQQHGVPPQGHAPPQGHFPPGYGYQGFPPGYPPPQGHPMQYQQPWQFPPLPNHDLNMQMMMHYQQQQQQQQGQGQFQQPQFQGQSQGQPQVQVQQQQQQQQPQAQTQGQPPAVASQPASQQQAAPPTAPLGPKEDKAIPTAPQGFQGPPHSGPYGYQPGPVHVSPNHTIPPMDENARLAKRNEMISKRKPHNNLMTGGDKDFVLRVQLQQMVTEDPYNEDFYYQVHSAINVRSNPNQPLDAFARTYLYQRGQRGRRARGNENGLQRLQQQVHKAVQFVKDHPKKDSIISQGALGKIHLGSNKGPRQALDLRKRDDTPDADNSTEAPTEGVSATPELRSATPVATTTTTTDAIRSITTSISKFNLQGGSYVSANDKRGILRAIENVYIVLLRLEAAERTQPEDDLSDEFQVWKGEKDALVTQLWRELQITAPIDQADGSLHPFIAMLSHAKCKKAIPRVFRHISAEQRLTILTMIMAHIGDLDVVKNGHYSGEESNLPAKSREAIEVFSQTVLPPLVQYISEAEYGVIVGLLELMMDRNDTAAVVKTKVGSAFVTVLISRAELINQEGSVSAEDEETWNRIFNRVFGIVQRNNLNSLFPPRNVDDSYVWQFLASIALAAKIDHQRVMVDDVRDKIFGTMNEAKALPPDLSQQKINNLNLFLNVMGLNATTSEIGELQG